MELAAEPLASTMQSWRESIDRALEGYLGTALECPPRLREAMRYSLFAGGKRLRPLLVLLASDACFGSIDSALPAAAAVEMIHTYSLIHDDLPAMDDDDTRRGKPACHRQFDEATAILAGDALLTCAFGALADVRPAVVAVNCVRELARAAGAAGMVGGQHDDLRAIHGPRSLEWLESLHARKTGALLTASLRIGGFIAGAGPERLQALQAYGEHIGLAFQIVDDVLDVEGSAHKLGKPVRKDREAGKLTYPELLGIAESRRRAEELAALARQDLVALGPSAYRLAALADFIIHRDS